MSNINDETTTIVANAATEQMALSFVGAACHRRMRKLM
jgi:hypothetical protein